MSKQITLTYYSERVDNWGKTESSHKPKLIIAALKNMTDDMFFEGTDENGKLNCFYPDDLSKKTVKVGEQLVEVPE